jgi:hypothetical protein
MKFSIAALVSAAAVAVAAPAPVPAPPGIPSASTARSLLAGLRVATPTNEGTYDRDAFPHWVGVSGNCDAREYVLQRDGTSVQVDGACYPTSGRWTSPYDGATWTNPTDIDIDHMVPLKNAWISGAASWSTSQRQAFANDVSGPQLWAVTDNVNQQKSDRSPDQWLPPLTSFRCTYAASWVQVKSKYSLSITTAERSTLSSILNGC